MKFKVLAILMLISTMFIFQGAETVSTTRYWMKIKASNKFERGVVANQLAIEVVAEDYVIAYGDLENKKYFESKGWLVASSPLVSSKDFPQVDSAFHNYDEMKNKIFTLVDENPKIAEVMNLGLTHEGRAILGIRISGNLENADKLPAVFFMGGHHAREHVSVEVPLRFAEHLITEYKAGNQRIVNLVNGRDIHILPATNPDGLEYDVEGGKYKSWRKNRRKNANGTMGVDLNRNYGYKWSTIGASDNPSSDVYHGTAPFSEPETVAIKNWIETHTNISTVLSFHTYSKLILWPWGHLYESIADERDLKVHETMGKAMAKWNGYKPEQSSDLYATSGDLTDWAYGEHKIISFTFELDPDSSSFGGFYPGAAVIPEVVKKNLEPCLYLLEYADNPYRVLDESRTELRSSVL